MIASLDNGVLLFAMSLTPCHTTLETSNNHRYSLRNMSSLGSRVHDQTVSSCVRCLYMLTSDLTPHLNTHICSFIPHKCVTIPPPPLTLMSQGHSWYLSVFAFQIPSSNKVCVTVTFQRAYEVGKPQPSTASVYSYYEPGTKCWYDICYYILLWKSLEW